LSDSDAGQQKSSEQCAMHACHILEFEWNSIVTKTAAVVISEASLVERAGRPRPAIMALDGREARRSTESLIITRSWS
jgi:hypothetical protein